MKRFYHPTEVKARIASLNAVQNNDGGAEDTYKETFFNPQIRGAAWVGIGLATFQQLTGINVIIFFSGSLFDENFATQGTAIVNFANFVSTIAGMGLLGIAGRKTLMAILQVFVIITMFLLWFYQTPKHSNDYVTLGMAVAFICAFEFGPGPIVWLYISEICNNKATSVGTVVNWFWTLLISVMAPFLLNNWL